MKIRLLCVGRLSEAYLRDGTEEFLQRVRRYLPADVVELKEEKIGGRRPDIARIREREGERLLAKVSDGACLIVLDERGRGMTSPQLADFLEEHMVHATPALDFVIGGPYGVSDAVRQRAALVLSLSKMTLTHQMVRLFLLEQLYRAMTIVRNEPYHNR